jgi:hypothetical protein
VLVRAETRWLASIAAVYLSLRVWSFAGIAGHASSFTDTPEYKAVARLPLFSLDFWTWLKPWGTPLLWKLLPGATDVSAPIAQWLISVAGWLILAFVLFAVLEHRPVKLAGFALILAFSLVPAVAAVWDGALLSESLSLSLSALLLAALLLLVRSPDRKWVAAALLLAFLLAGTRAPNGYLAPFLLIPVALVVHRSRRIAIALAAGSLAIAAMTYATTNARQWQVALAEIVAGRVLHKPSEQAYFVARGMPFRPTLEKELWANRYPPYSKFETAPTLAWFLPWFNQEARAVYRDYLLSHPADAIIDPIRDLPLMVSPSMSTNDLQGLPLSVYPARGYRSSLPDLVARILYPTSAKLLLIWGTLSVAVMAALVAMRLGRAIWAIPLLGLVSCVPNAIILWDGADTSIGRHALLLAVVFRLSLVMTVLFVVDAYLTGSGIEPSLKQRRVHST